MEAKTAYLAYLLKSLGADIRATGSNPLSTQDDVVASLKNHYGVNVNARHGCSLSEYDEFINWALDIKPDIIIDDGGDLIDTLLNNKRDLIAGVKGGLEQTTTGVKRLKVKYSKNEIPFPMLAVNDATIKYMFDNRYGTGQSALTAILKSTNMTLASKTVVVCGYGWCGKGLAQMAKGLNARVIVTETDELSALTAVFDGFSVMESIEAAKLGDIFITATGTNKVLTKEHFAVMKDGALLSNAGHFDVEVDIKYLNENASEIKEVRENVREYNIFGKKLYIIGEGRLVNLAAGDGHPIEIMDMSFSMQLLGAIYLCENVKNLPKQLLYIPCELEKKAARIKLDSMGIKIDSLSSEQKKYLYGDDK
ncbi:MAG: adenosylhomocysteinase [Eubacteriales bacterium]